MKKLKEMFEMKEKKEKVELTPEEKKIRRKKILWGAVATVGCVVVGGLAVVLGGAAFNKIADSEEETTTTIEPCSDAPAEGESNE